MRLRTALTAASLFLLGTAVAPSLASAQPMPGNCHPSADGTSMICDAVNEIVEADLAGKIFIDKNTFAGQQPSEWTRDDVELEGAMEVGCLKGVDLLKVLKTEKDGKTAYQKLRRPSEMEAFTVSYGIDEMPWDSDSHKLREASPNVWLTVESGRYEPDTNDGGARKLSVGTDIMDDVYYDTPDFRLLSNDMLLRGRARWDTPTEIRRLLIAAKFGSGMDAFGLKRDSKLDIRNDGASPAEIASLDADVRGGMIAWNGSAKQPAAPVKEIYERLVAGGKLPEVGAHGPVMLLEAKTYLRSTRSRYHLNEAPLDAVANLYKQGGADRMNGLLAQIAAARGANAIPAADAPAVDAFEAKIKGILDGSLVAAKAKEALLKVDPQMTVDASSIASLMPGAPSTGAMTEAELAKRKAVSDAVKSLYHEVGSDVDGVRRTITMSNGDVRKLESEVDRYAAFLKSQDPELAKKTTYDPIESAWKTVAALPDADRKAKLDAYNTWAAARKQGGDKDFEKWKPLDEKAFANLGAAITNEKVRVWGRQIEAAGSAAQGLWFDQARSFYIPGSYRKTGNFMIDTMDMTEMYSPEAWASIPAAERTAGSQLPLDKAFHGVLVNELQIELGEEKSFMDRIHALKASLDTDRASLFMRYATGAGIAGANDDAAYRKLLGDLAAKSDADLQPTLDALNAFAKAQGSQIDPMTAADLRGLAPTLLTVANRDRAIRTDRTTEHELTGALFVFNQYKDQLKTLSAVKGKHVVKTLKKFGAPACTEWSDIKAAKGEQALEILRDGQPNG